MRRFVSSRPLWWSQIPTSTRLKKFIFLERQMVVCLKLRL